MKALHSSYHCEEVRRSNLLAILSMRTRRDCHAIARNDMIRLFSINFVTAYGSDRKSFNIKKETHVMRLYKNHMI